jgi:hypothetical protein
MPNDRGAPDTCLVSAPASRSWRLSRGQLPLLPWLLLEERIPRSPRGGGLVTIVARGFSIGVYGDADLHERNNRAWL